MPDVHTLAIHALLHAAALRAEIVAQSGRSPDDVLRLGRLADIEERMRRAVRILEDCRARIAAEQAIDEIVKEC